MKIIFLKSFLPIYLFLLPFLLTAQSKPSCAEFEGIWEYDLPDVQGMWFSQNDRILWVLVPKERKHFLAEDPTPQEKANAFEELNVSAGTLKCEGQRATITYVYNKNPEMGGQSFQFDYEFKDGKSRYWIIQPDGSRGPEGNSKKIADFAMPSQESCETSDSFWEYDLPDQYGICVLGGGYFGWVLIQKEFWDTKPDLSTSENKAMAFDKIIAAVGSYDCKEEGKPRWKTLHGIDDRTEGESFITENDHKGDVLRWWFLDEEGRRTGTGGKAKRLK